MKINNIHYSYCWKLQEIYSKLLQWDIENPAFIRNKERKCDSKYSYFFHVNRTWLNSLKLWEKTAINCTCFLSHKTETSIYEHMVYFACIFNSKGKSFQKDYNIVIWNSYFKVDLCLTSDLLFVVKENVLFLHRLPEVTLWGVTLVQDRHTRTPNSWA